MPLWNDIQSKISADWASAQSLSEEWRSEGCLLVFTNGCFDLLHLGHIHYLAAARELGDRLIVGLNSTESVRRLKGGNRPIKDEATRAHLLAALRMVDMVVLFPQDTPLELIRTLRPDILSKGGDYIAEEIVGYQEVTAHGGRVEILDFLEGYSTTAIEQRIKNGK